MQTIKIVGLSWAWTAAGGQEEGRVLMLCSTHEVGEGEQSLARGVPVLQCRRPALGAASRPRASSLRPPPVSREPGPEIGPMQHHGDTGERERERERGRAARHARDNSRHTLTQNDQAGQRCLSSSPEPGHWLGRVPSDPSGPAPQGQAPASLAVCTPRWPVASGWTPIP